MAVNVTQTVNVQTGIALIWKMRSLDDQWIEIIEMQMHESIRLHPARMHACMTSARRSCLKAFLLQEHAFELQGLHAPAGGRACLCNQATDLTDCHVGS